MKPFEVGKQALGLLWRHRVLWFFGFFVAAAGGAGGGSPARGGPQGSGGGVPPWVWPLLGVAAVLGVAALVMHVVSEGALIEGVRRARQGEATRLSEGIAAGLRSFWRVLRVKLVLALVLVASAAVVAAPALLGALGRLPWWLAVALTVPLGLLAVPWLLTWYLTYVFGLRIAVLESKPALGALAEGRQFLRGRLLDSLQLLVVTFLGQVGGGAVAVAVLLAAAAVGGLVYLAAGLVPALAVGGALAAPALAAVVGAMGAFRSAVWTVGYLEGRAEAGAA